MQRLLAELRTERADFGTRRPRRIGEIGGKIEARLPGIDQLSEPRSDIGGDEIGPVRLLVDGWRRRKRRLPQRLRPRGIARALVEDPIMDSGDDAPQIVWQRSEPAQNHQPVFDRA